METDELRATLEETADEISRFLPDPKDWGSWIVFLLEKLEANADDRPAFNEMLRSVHDYLTAHIEGTIR